MKKLFVSILVIGIFALALLFLASRFTNIFLPKGIGQGETKILTSSSLPSDPPNTSSSVSFIPEVVAQELDVPWSIVFTSEKRMLVSERTGGIRVVENDQLRSEPLITLDQVSPVDEAGLMGMVLDPDYQNNKFFYACYAYDSSSDLKDRVIKLKDNGSSAEVILTIIENIPAARFHAGCRLGIGPDQKLYITTGDATDPENAQNMNSLGGKILRLNLDGSIPSDNPFPNSPVYSLGHRNPQGIDWHPVTGELYSSEHGPSGNDGPPGGDEVNRIIKAENYGWPIVSHEKSKSEYKDPLIVFTPAEAPGSIMVYSGKVFPQFTHNLFFGALKGEGLIRLEINATNPDEITSYEKLEIDYGRIREVVESPEGLIYFTTSNRDGRGTLNPNDDKIVRIIPKNLK